MPPHGMAVTGTDCTHMPGIGRIFSGYLSMITSSIRVACRNSQFRGTHKFLRVHHVFEETLLLWVCDTVADALPRSPGCTMMLDRTTWPATDALRASRATTRSRTPEFSHGWSRSPKFWFGAIQKKNEYQQNGSVHTRSVWTRFFPVWSQIKCQNYECVVQNMQTSHQFPLLVW
jgi:hypothetical protein